MSSATLHFPSEIQCNYSCSTQKHLSWNILLIDFIILITISIQRKFIRSKNETKFISENVQIEVLIASSAHEKMFSGHCSMNDMQTLNEPVGILCYFKDLGTYCFWFYLWFVWYRLNRHQRIRETCRTVQAECLDLPMHRSHNFDPRRGVEIGAGSPKDAASPIPAMFWETCVANCSPQWVGFVYIALWKWPFSCFAQLSLTCSWHAR